MVEVVASGIMGSNSGVSTTTSCTGSGVGSGIGAGIGAMAFFFFGFFLLIMKPATAPKTQQSKIAKKTHCQTCKYEPKEPEASEPRLA